MRIQHNMQSMNNNRMLGITNQNKAKSAEKLASGYKINRAGDDAAGLSISEKMRKQMRGLDRGVDNVQDGISFCQTADGALNEVCDMLNRMKVLSIQSANGTNSEFDRRAIDKEIQKLKEESERIFQTTSFNDQHIWERIPVYKKVTDTIEYYTMSFSYPSPATKLTDKNVTTWPKGSFELEQDDQGVRFKWDAIDGNTYRSNIIPWPTPNTRGMTLKLWDNLPDNMKNDEKFQGLDAQITYYTSEYTTFDEVQRYLSSAKVTPSPSKPGSAQLMGNTAATASYGFSTTAIQKSNVNLDGYADTSFATFDSMTNIGANNDDSTKQISFKFNFVNRANPTTSTTVTANPISVTMYKYVESFDEADRVTRDDETRNIDHNHSDSDEYFSNDGWWGKYVSVSWSGNKTYRNVHNDISQNLTNFSAASIAEVLTTNSANPTLGGLLNDKNNSAASGSADSVAITLNYSLKAGNDDYGSFSITLRGSENDTVDHFLDQLRGITEADIYQSVGGIGNADSTTPGTGTSNTVRLDGYNDAIYPQTKELTHSVLVGYKDLHKNIHSAPEADMEVKIFIDYACLSNLGLGIRDMNVLTIEKSHEAMGLIDEAARRVVEQRSLFGAYQNRLEHTTNNLNNVVENTTAAESRLRDTDIADEMVRQSTERILQQAGQSMLAQANQTTNGVMSLLQS